MAGPIDVTSAQARLWLQEANFSLGASQFSFSIPGAGASWAGYAAGSEPFKVEYAVPNAALATAFRSAITLWDDYILPDFREVSEATGSVGELRIAFTNVGDSFGYAYSGTPQAAGRQVGDIWINPSTAAAGYAVGDYGFMAVLHEVGHTLGLKHSFDDPAVPTAFDNYRYTLMSYTRSETTVRFETSPNGGLRSSSSSVNAATPMVLDILAAQAVYGAETTTRAGDNVYSFTPLQPVLQTIYDAGGSDRIDASNMNTKVVIDLRAGAYSSIGVQTLADQIAYWSALHPGASSFIRSTLTNTANLFTYTENVAIAFGVTVENATGGSANDSITGNETGNILNGGAGADTLIGLGGDDIYQVDQTGDVVVENANEGVDTVQTSVDYVLSVASSVEVLTTSNTAATVAINLTGSTGDQTITGNNGANIINGFGGSDTMVGLAGDDTFLVRGMGDVVIEGNGGGNDTVFTTVSYNLGVNEVERLSTVVQADTVNIDLIGNFVTQAVIGNYGSNVLNGGSGGLDTLIGLFGNDVYAVGDSRTMIFENANEGSDTVVVAVDYSLAAGVSIEVLAAQNRTATVGLTLRGNEVAQTIVGNDGDNVIDGRGGADLLIGRGGADVFAFTVALGDGSIDIIQDFAGGSDKIGLASDVFAALTAGGIQGGEFVLGTGAGDGDDRLIYDQGTGRLFYDADANGAGAAALFAQLSAGVPLAAADFIVIAPLSNLPG